MSDNTPDTAVGAHSASDNGPQQTFGDVSAAALANAKAAFAGQLQDMASGSGVGTDSAGGLQRTVSQQQGFTTTFHTPAISYTIPLG